MRTYIVLPLSIIISCFLSFANAQTFNQRIAHTVSFAGSLGASMVPIGNDHYFSVTISLDSIIEPYEDTVRARMVDALIFRRHDAFGIPYWDTVIKIRDYSVQGNIQAMHKQDDNSFVWAYACASASDNDYGVKFITRIIRFDSNAHIITQKDFYKTHCLSYTADTPNIYLEVLQPTRYGEWLLGELQQCSFWSPPRSVAVLRKLDNDFNEIWQKSFNIPSYTNSTTEIRDYDTAYSLLWFAYTTGRYEDYRTLRSYDNITLLDTAGNLKSTLSSYADSAQEMFFATMLTANGDYIVSGRDSGIILDSLSMDPLWSDRYMIKRIRADGSLVWHCRPVVFKNDSWGNYGFHWMYYLPNGNLLLGGGINYGYDWEDYYTDTLRGERFKNLDYAALIIIDTATGEVLKRRKYFSGDNEVGSHWVHNIQPSGDGGWLIIGEANAVEGSQNHPTQRSWFVKVDSNLCEQVNEVQCWPVSVSGTAELAELVKVYPNPVQDVLYVEYGGTAAARLQLYDIMGRLQRSAVLQRGRNSIDCSALAPGVYLYKIHSAKEGLAGQGKLVK